MKSLSDFVNEASYPSDVALLFEDVFSENNDLTLQECYEEIFDRMYSINEGVFSKIGSWLAKKGEAIQKGGENLDKKIEQASDAAKKAIASAKKKAGQAWDKVKTGYSNVVLTIDQAIQDAKKGYETFCEKAGIKIEEFEAKCGQIYSNAMTKSKEFADNMGKWIADKTEGATKMGAINTLILGAMMAKKAGLDSSMCIDILSSAGFN